MLSYIYYLRVYFKGADSMANDSLDRFNTGRVFVQTPNVDYSVPEFLLDKFDNIGGERDFNSNYVNTKAEVPLWWTKDVEIPITKKEYKKAAKQMLIKKQMLEEQRIALESANAEIMSKLSEQEQEYNKKVTFLEKQIDERTAQLQLYNHNIQLKYQKSLLEMEHKLQTERKERELLIFEKEKLGKLSEEEIKADILDSDTKRVLSDINKEIEAMRAENDAIRKELVQKYAEMGISYIPPTVTATGNVKAKHQLTEDFSELNILECRYLTLFNREKSLNEIEDISFNVKKQGKTVVYAPAVIVEGIMTALMRTFPSNITKTTGFIRVEGIGDEALTPENYRKDLAQKVISSSYVADDFFRMNKSFAALFKGKLPAEADKMLKMMSVSKEAISRKLSKLDEVTIMKLAVIFSLIKNAPLAVIDNIEDEFEEKDLSAFYEMLNAIPATDRAVLLLTSSRRTAAAVMDVRLYDLMPK